MRSKNVLSFSTLAAFITSLGMGCEGTDVKLAPVPPAAPIPSQPVPKDLKQGGGPGSSGNLKTNPGQGRMDK